MRNSLKDIIVISHAQCTDGWGSIHAMYSIFKDRADYFTFSHTNAEEIMTPWISQLANKTVIVVDYALPVNVWLQLKVIAKQIITLDHHHSAFVAYSKQTSNIITIDQLTADHLNQKIITVFDMNHSGAMLALKFANLFEISSPNGRSAVKLLPFSDNEFKLYSLIQDMDLFRLVFADSNPLYSAISNTAKLTDCLKTNCQPLSSTELADSVIYYQHVVNNLDQVLAEGKIKYAMYQEQVADLAKQANDITLTIHKNDKEHIFNGKIMNANSLFSSALGSTLAEQSKSFAMLYSITDNKVKISFRSIKEYDCSMIAELFGGGGHKQASACVVSLDILSKILTQQIITL